MRAALLVLAAAVAVGACGGPRRAYPRWTLVGPPEAGHDCVRARAFVRMSGKAGVGVTLQLRSLRDCSVRVVTAHLDVGGTRAPAALPGRLDLRGRSQVYLWLPFRFDNDAAWNRGDRRGRFVLQLETNGALQPPWTIAAEHRFDRRWQPEAPRW